MKKRCLLFCLLFLTLGLCLASGAAHAQQAPEPAALTTPPDATPQAAPAVPPTAVPVAAPAPPALPVTPLEQSLQKIIGTSPPSPPVAALTTTANSNNDDSALQFTDTFATGLLDSLARMVDRLKTNSTALDADLSAWPDFTDWLHHQFNDPHRRDLWNAIGGDLLIIVGVPLLGGIAIFLFLLPLRLNLWRKRPAALHERIGLLFALLFLRLIPVFVFLGGSLLLLDQNETHRLARFVILSIIYALAAGYTIRQVLRCVLAPRADHLRAFALVPSQARYGFRWSSAFVLSIIYGYFFIDVATALRVPASTIGLFQNLLGLLLTTMAIIVIVQTREHVATIIRGPSVEEDQPGFNHAVRVWLSQHWHRIITLYLVIGLVVTWFDIDDGITLMLRGTILSFFILALARLGFVAMDSWVAPTSNTSNLLHRQLLSFLLRPLMWGIVVVALAASWGMDFRSFVATNSGQHFTTAFISVLVTLFVLTVIYEMLNMWIERYLNRRDKNSKLPIASARARTLLPMMRNTIFILFCGITILICLSAIGINIGPLLAGAGVVGVAIGFGSQTLVKDFLTGLFIVIENTIAVGDVVKIGTFGGVVEALSIRTIRLRDSDGALHILPFSEVSKITNMTKGFAYALVNVAVSYNSDLERVMDVLREVGAEIQEDAVFKRVILEPIEVMGVENLGDSSITIQARIRTRPGKQWDVRRLLLLRIKQRFDKEKIEIPFPTVTQITKGTS